MKTRGWVLVGIVACAGLFGCTLQTGESAGETVETDVASAGQAIIGGWASVFHWDQGQPPLRLEPSNSHVCALTAIGGHFAGTGESVRVTVNGSNWELNGSSAQSGVFGEATCFPLAKFGGSGLHFFSNETVADAWSRGKAAGQDKGGGCQQAQNNVGLGSDFGFIEGMQGEMAGGGEASFAIPSPSVNTINILRSQICTTGHHLTFGRWLRVSPYQGFLAKFMDAKGNVNDLDGIREFSLTHNGSGVFADSVTMAPIDRAMCAFTSISGKFFGDRELARISSNGTNWVLTIAQGRGSNFMSVGARCFARFQ